MKHLYLKGLCALALAIPLAAQAQTPTANLTQADFTGIMVPRYMGSGSMTRLPVAYYARVANLTPNATYRYYNQAAIATDLGTTNSGAGNPLLVLPNGDFLYTSQPKLKPGASSSFTTDGSGAYQGWFLFVNTGNASRFTTPGTQVIPSLILNNGTAVITDSLPAKRLALDQTVTLLKFDAAAGPFFGTGIYGASVAAAKTFVALYDNLASTGRPLSITYTEDEGITVASTVGYYTNNVNGISGSWGTIIPNTLATGVQNISAYNLQGSLIANNTAANGQFGGANTVNPTGAATAAISISAAAAPLNSITASRTRLPQPTVARSGDVFTIRTAEPQMFYLMDVHGRVLYQSEVGNQAAVDLATYAPGMYLLQSSRSAAVRLIK